VIERTPTTEEYQHLRRSVGWTDVDDDAASRGLSRALTSFCLVTDRGDVVGIARVIGDGGIYFYVQDVIVDEAYRGRGHGRALMDAVMAFVAQRATRGAFVGLMAARDVAAFYEPYGFVRRPPDRPGMAMTWGATGVSGAAGAASST
jgi:ribosomal protein S18 acetylase RimI-like enzyme